MRLGNGSTGDDAVNVGISKMQLIGSKDIFDEILASQALGIVVLVIDLRRIIAYSKFHINLQRKIKLLEIIRMTGTDNFQAVEAGEIVVLDRLNQARLVFFGKTVNQFAMDFAKSLDFIPVPVESQKTVAGKRRPEPIERIENGFLASHLEDVAVEIVIKLEELPSQFVLVAGFLFFV